MGSKPFRILVAGAGPSGLAFALTCAAAGIYVRIVEQRPARSLMGKATGVAQGVWRQLERFGITETSITNAIAMKNFVFHDEGKEIAAIQVPEISGSAPAHLFPQSELELHMEDALRALGVHVEYGTTLIEFTQSPDAVLAKLGKTGETSPETYEADWLIGADGAHSQVRQMLRSPFIGRDYPEQWSVAEIITSQWTPDAQARLFLQRNGVGLFLSQPSYGNVQGILNAPGASAQLKERFPDAELKYERNFRVALRRVPNPRIGHVWLIGDAAHIQSPVGGQGLNLAIWDGITLAEGLLSNDPSVQHRLVQRAKRVLFFTDFDYRMLATRRPHLRALRNLYWKLAARYPIIANWFFKVISGVW